MSINVNIFLRSAVKAVGFFVFMFGLSWRLTLVTLMGFPFIAVVSKVYGEYYKVGTHARTHTHMCTWTTTRWARMQRNWKKR